MLDHEDYTLSPLTYMILEEYRQNLPVYKRVQEFAIKTIKDCLDKNKIYITALDSRIKTEKSLAGKLEVKGNKYLSTNDITDLVGLRVITFYSDEVDKIAALLENIFVIDWENSIDKRKMHDLNSFGYMSLHYICQVPKSLYYDPECPQINEMRFEVQIRTALQHVWANINHSIGYKRGMEIPVEYLRNLTRLAGLLELADEQFSRIRRDINNYKRQVQELVADGDFDRVPLNSDTFKSYLELGPFNRLLNKIASINQAEIAPDNLMPFLDILVNMGFKTLGDLEKLIRDYSDGAYQLALFQIGSTDLDIIASSITIQNLCQVYIIKNGGGINELAAFYNEMGGGKEYNKERAARMIEQAKKINIV